MDKDKVFHTLTDNGEFKEHSSETHTVRLSALSSIICLRRKDQEGLTVCNPLRLSPV